jgi:hypothetical protein
LQRELGSATKVALVPKPVNLEKEIYQQQMWGQNEVSSTKCVLEMCAKNNELCIWSLFEKAKVLGFESCKPCKFCKEAHTCMLFMSLLPLTRFLCHVVFE